MSFILNRVLIYILKVNTLIKVFKSSRRNKLNGFVELIHFVRVHWCVHYFISFYNKGLLNVESSFDILKQSLFCRFDQVGVHVSLIIKVINFYVGVFLIVLFIFPLAREELCSHTFRVPFEIRRLISLLQLGRLVLIFSNCSNSFFA